MIKRCLLVETLQLIGAAEISYLCDDGECSFKLLAVGMQAKVELVRAVMAALFSVDSFN